MWSNTNIQFIPSIAGVKIKYTQITSSTYFLLSQQYYSFIIVYDINISKSKTPF
jgi:hypothetical protein